MMKHDRKLWAVACDFNQAPDSLIGRKELRLKTAFYSVALKQAIAGHDPWMV
jgi:hypothetical protein